MPIDIERYNEVVVARLEDELLEESALRLRAALAEPLRQGCRQLVIDFERTEFVDSAGLTCLKEIAEQMQAESGTVKISGLSGHCRKIFEMTRFEKRFELFGTLIDAVRSFR